ncbi:hypothetical protein Tco_0950044, partial [Tanacetum coccineum]
CGHSFIYKSMLEEQGLDQVVNRSSVSMQGRRSFSMQGRMSGRTKRRYWNRNP